MPKSGFPTASKLLFKYEKERAYKQHKQKMEEMRHGLDNDNPHQYKHLEVRMKRLQKDEERQMLVDHENELLVKKMRRIMTRKGRLDNWNPDYQPKSLHTSYRERQQEQIAVENAGMAKRLEKVGPVYHVKDWEEDFHRHEYILEKRAEETKEYEEITPRRQKRTAVTRQKPKTKQKEPPPEEKYEDDFESEEEDTKADIKNEADKESNYGNQNGRRESTSSEKDSKRQTDENQPDEKKLPKIETKPKESESKNPKQKDSNGTNKKSPRQSQVSKLPSVSPTKKDSVKEDKFALYRNDKQNSVMKNKTQHKKGTVKPNNKTVKSNKTANETVARRDDIDGHRSVAEENSSLREDPETGEPDVSQQEDQTPKQSETTSSTSDNEKTSEEDKPPENAHLNETENKIENTVNTTENTTGDNTDKTREENEGKPTEVNKSKDKEDDKVEKIAEKSETAKEKEVDVTNGPSNKDQKSTDDKVPPSAKSVHSSHANKDDVTSLFSQNEVTSLSESDAKQLFRVCKQLEAPDDIIIKTLVRRSPNQRSQTMAKFRDLYDLDLIPELRNSLGEPWHPIINALLTDMEASDATTLHNALMSKDISSIVETLCTRNTSQLSNLREAYRKEYAIGLEDEITEKIENPVQLFLLSLLKSSRTESTEINENEAEKDARELYESGEGRWTSDTGKFIRLIEQKNQAQFRTTLNMFKQISGGKDIMVSIREDCYDQEDYVEAVTTLINCSKGSQMYFCEKLHGIKDLSDPSFVNCLISRSETDMPGTRKSFKKRYNKELADHISSKGPHDTIKVLLEFVNRGAPGQYKSKTQPGKKATQNQTASQSKKPASKRPDRKDESTSKHNPLDKPGKRVLAEAKLKREVEEKAKTKQPVQKREKTKVDKSPTAVESNANATLKPSKDFSDEKDADRLYQAMDGLGTNEDQIMEILAQRTNSQRQQIKKTYNKKYDRDLTEDLKSELSGSFEELILALLMEPLVYDAYCIHDGVKGLGTDEAALVASLSTRTRTELQAIKEQYNTIYKSDLDKDVSADKTNVFKRMLVEVFKSSKDEEKSVDEEQAKQDAQKLFKEDTKSLSVSDDTFIKLLTQQNKSQIEATFKEYKKIAGHDVFEGIKLAMLGDEEDGYIALAKASDDVTEFYAGRLHHSMTRDVGTDDRMLIRIIVSRSEIDLASIKTKYSELYGKPLHEEIESECGDDFKKTLLLLLGDKVPINTKKIQSPPQSTNKKGGDQVNKNDMNNEPIKMPDTSQDLHVTKQDAKPQNEIQQVQSSKVTDDNSEDNKKAEEVHDSPKKSEPISFEPGRDCEQLFTLLNDKDIDQKQVFEILVRRSHRQRLQLRQKYQLLYRQDLVRELRNNLPPSLEIVIGALTLEKVEFDTLCLHQAVSGIGVDDRTLVNILVSRDTVHLKAVKIKFWQVYGKDLIDYLRRITNSELGELLLVLSCLTEQQTPDRESDEQISESAQKLARKLSTGEKSYLDLFHKKSGEHINKIFRKYSEITGKDIGDSFQKYKHGEVQTALIAFSDYLSSHTLFYVHQLKQAMTDPGVDGIILIHIIVCRTEIDLAEIKRSYIREYGVSLEDDLTENCKADYCQVLLLLLKNVN